MYYSKLYDRLKHSCCFSLALAIDKMHWCGPSTEVKRGVIHICRVLQSLSAIKLKVKGQLETFFVVNSWSNCSRPKQNFSNNICHYQNSYKKFSVKILTACGRRSEYTTYASDTPLEVHPQLQPKKTNVCKAVLDVYIVTKGVISDRCT